MLRIIRFRGGDPTSSRRENMMIAIIITSSCVRAAGSPLVPQVTYCRLRAAVAAEQQPAAEQNIATTATTDNREPEFHFTEHFDIGQVNGVDGDEEDRREPR